MVQSNRLGAQCLHAHGATACTDVTGFGVLGHLVEMTKPSGVDVHISLSALPLLDGAVETVAAGIVSSLQSSNVRLRRALHNQTEFVQHPRYPLLFDPQTAGGLLASVPANRATACLAALHALGYIQAAIVGRIVAQSDVQAPVTLLE
jgi:selenide,water dikinase